MHKASILFAKAMSNLSTYVGDNIDSRNVSFIVLVSATASTVAIYKIINGFTEITKEAIKANKDIELNSKIFAMRTTSISA